MVGQRHDVSTSLVLVSPAWSDWRQHSRGRRPAGPVDRIVAVVNDEVITLHELRSRLDSALGQLQRQGMPRYRRAMCSKGRCSSGW
jgi:hypothetical protein